MCRRLVLLRGASSRRLRSLLAQIPNPPGDDPRARVPSMPEARVLRCPPRARAVPAGARGRGSLPGLAVL
eukprot:15463885-Alexandrium_andersonii.AAC.1